MRNMTFGLLVVLGIVAYPVFSAVSPEEATLVELGQAVPAVSCTTLSGDTLDTNALKGKVVLINFFATWCGPCKAEMPALDAEIYQKIKHPDLVVVAIGREHTAAELRKFKQDHGYTFPMAPDPQRAIYGLFAQAYIPRNVVIGKDGRIKWLSVGYTKREFAGMISLIKEELAVPAETVPADPLDQYNVVWDSPSQDYNGSMPIGNGDIGMNVWVEPSGDLLLLISKTDAWSENGRLLKLGRGRVKLSPNPFAGSASFQQVLNLRRGEILISGGKADQEVRLRIWVDANRSAIRLQADGAKPLRMEAELEVWRNQRRQLGDKEINSAYGLQGAPFPVYVQPDTVLKGQRRRVVWYHRNQSSIWENNLQHQGMADFIAQATDPLLNRTFGACMRGSGMENRDARTLVSKKPQRHLDLSIHSFTAQTDTAGIWLRRLDQLVKANDGQDLQAQYRNHSAWWDQFWNRSWIRISGSPEAEAVTRGYVLQRWMSACAGRGAHPIKFNGSIFTVDGDGFDADYRRWGGPYWWQNTRLPYWPMLASGDFDMMLPLFSMYQATLPLAEQRTRTWFGHAGAFIGETVYFWGMYNNTNYGWQRPPDLPVGVLTNRYINREYTASPELMAMLLDYYAYTQDNAFLSETLLPLGDSLLAFWDQHYKTDAQGHMRMYPGQALETLQDAANPTPDVAGLKWVLGRLMAIPGDKVGGQRQAFWKRLLDKVPPLPMGKVEGKHCILGAAEVFGGRGNSENPELYAIFPFRLYGVGKPDLDIGRHTFLHRPVKGNNGWRQDDTQAALLGLTEIATDYVVRRAQNKHTGSRFPAFWGPNFDWIPDQTHGGNLQMAVQCMLMQTDDGKIRLLPAWPKHWNADFKLHAPQRTVVQGSVMDGKVMHLKVSPQSRRDDVIIMTPH